ncbi:MAG TPA: lysine--tRNA ligase [Candidatus Paceibacterota bacterium]|nr:lysine--tRNA ligase [Candidatus Paceibacterota bacterium]
MATVEELKKVRIEKLNKIQDAGIDPYPAKVSKTHDIFDLNNNYQKIFESNEKVSIVGRIMSIRGQGAIIFLDLFDGTGTGDSTGRFQAVLKSDNNLTHIEKSDISGFEFFKEVVDTGDFVMVSGKLFETKRGQKSIEVSEWQMVAKSLRPIPDEWFGLKDEDERYRRRYIDIILNPESRKIIEQKSVFWNSFRNFLLKKNFIEVQTPVLENTTGGADARPFVTHHNALDIDVYLRISCGELWQKKLLVAGLPKVFEIGRIFRNEGMSKEHLQDYTQIEFYEAYSDYKSGMEMVKELYRTVANETFGTAVFEINDKKVDLNDDWQIFDFVKILHERFGVDVLSADINSIISILKKNKIDFDKNINKEKAVDQLWKSIRGEYAGPGFLINIPVFLEPLAKKSFADDRVVERFQIILGGSEMGKGFSELNNPLDQKERFDHQDSLRKSGDDEAQMNDGEYVEAMEYGMPPAFGFGISERLFSVLAGKSIRETTIFPIMKPRDEK